MGRRRRTADAAKGGAGPQQAGAGEGGAEAAGRGAERTDEEWVALLYVLGQPSEVRRRAAWEAVVGLPEMRGAGLAWADVEAEAGAAGRGQGGTAGSGADAAAAEVLVATTGEEVAEVARRGGVVDLGGREVELECEVVVAGAGVAVTIRNGTLRVRDAKLGNGYTLRVAEGGELRLEGVWVVGTGVQCEGGGRVTLVDTDVMDASFVGVCCVGRGSKVDMLRGRITVFGQYDGVQCIEGGKAEVWNVEMADCAVSCNGVGSLVVVQGGCIRGAQEYGVCCSKGAQAELRDVEITDCKMHGVWIHSEGSRVIVQGGCITGCKDFHGVCCQQGGHADLVGAEIASCKGNGVLCDGEGSRVVVHGGRITGSKSFHGVCCREGGHGEVLGVEITDCKQYGLCRYGNSTLTHSECDVSRCEKGSAFRC